ncbi:MAG TPA: hypothetical protein VMV56_07670 [Williamwhitmania sp.]|nr:hypothetical protein [Williamwhitmania sp.]
MKTNPHEIAAEWQPKNFATSCETFERMLTTFEFIGYEYETGRYRIKTSGNDIGFSYQKNRKLHLSAKEQAIAIGDYFYFDSKPELDAWLKGD